MARIENWNAELRTWLSPFLTKLGHKARRRMCPLYVAGLIGPGDRKSVQPMAERLAPGDYDQLHHFVAVGVWDTTALETELLIQADKLVGGGDAVLVIDNTAVPKKGQHSVGVAPQYASALGKNANCQTLVSLTLTRGEVPVVVALRLFLPESWTSDRVRLDRADVPVEYRAARTKPEIAFAEIDRVITAGVRFGCVLADAGYGLSAPFRQGLTVRGLAWAVGIPRHLKVYPIGVQLIWPIAARGRPRRRPVPDILSIAAEDMLADAKWQNVSWRTGTKGRLKARFAAVRVHAADGPRSGYGTRVSSISRGTRPGSSANTARRERRNTILPTCQRGEPAHVSCHYQGAMDLRAGSSATERGTRSRSLRRTILERPSSSRAHDNDRLRVPPASPSHQSEAGKKESTDHRLNQACQPCATPSSTSSFGRFSDARTAEDGLVSDSSMSKICQSSARACTHKEA